MFFLGIVWKSLLGPSKWKRFLMFSLPLKLTLNWRLPLLSSCWCLGLLFWLFFFFFPVRKVKSFSVIYLNSLASHTDTVKIGNSSWLKQKWYLFLVSQYLPEAVPGGNVTFPCGGDSPPGTRSRRASSATPEFCQKKSNKREHVRKDAVVSCWKQMWWPALSPESIPRTKPSW